MGDTFDKSSDPHRRADKLRRQAAELRQEALKLHMQVIRERNHKRAHELMVRALDRENRADALDAEADQIAKGSA